MVIIGSGECGQWQPVGGLTVVTEVSRLGLRLAPLDRNMIL